MFRYCATQSTCQCLPQRETPKTLRYDLLISILLPHLFPSFKNRQIVTYTIFLQCVEGADLYRAKSIFKIGLLALFFCCLNCHYIYRKGENHA